MHQTSRPVLGESKGLLKSEQQDATASSALSGTTGARDKIAGTWDEIANAHDEMLVKH